MKRRIWLACLLLHAALGSLALADAPKQSNAVTKAEQTAYDKAKCVHDAIATARGVFNTEGDGPDRPHRTDDENVQYPAALTPEAAKARLDTFQHKAQEGVQACLTESEVYDLGRYSYLEDRTISSNSGCEVSKAPAARVGNFVEGSAKWMGITDAASISAHPFFQGQNEARAEFSKAGNACAAILSEFGPQGNRLPGMIRSGAP